MGFEMSDLISRKAVVEMLKKEINKNKKQLFETELEQAYFYGRKAGTETIYNKIQSMPSAGSGRDEQN